jgi:SET domain-containing protein
MEHGVYAVDRIKDGQRIIEYVGEKIPSAAGTRHACSPNTKPKNRGGGICIIADRDIALGEELTYAYAFDADEPPVECN